MPTTIPSTSECSRCEFAQLCGMPVAVERCQTGIEEAQARFAIAVSCGIAALAVIEERQTRESIAKSAGLEFDTNRVLSALTRHMRRP